MLLAPALLPAGKAAWRPIPAQKSWHAGTAMEATLGLPAARNSPVSVGARRRQQLMLRTRGRAVGNQLKILSPACSAGGNGAKGCLLQTPQLGRAAKTLEAVATLQLLEAAAGRGAAQRDLCRQ